MSACVPFLYIPSVIEKLLSGGIIIDTEESAGRKSMLKSEIIDDNTLKLTFKNVTKFGTHNIEPMKIGTIADRKVWAFFRMFLLPETPSKMIAYSIYVEKK